MSRVPNVVIRTHFEVLILRLWQPEQWEEKTWRFWAENDVLMRTITDRETALIVKNNWGTRIRTWTN